MFLVFLVKKTKTRDGGVNKAEKVPFIA